MKKGIARRGTLYKSLNFYYLFFVAHTTELIHKKNYSRETNRTIITITKVFRASDHLNIKNVFLRDEQNLMIWGKDKVQ